MLTYLNVVSPWEYEPYQGDVKVVGGPKPINKAQEKRMEKEYLAHVDNLRKQRLAKEEAIGGGEIMMEEIMKFDPNTPQTDQSPATKAKYSTPHHRLTPSDWAEPNFSSPQAKITEIAQWNKFKHYLNN